jgi:hypothetical protein
LSTFCSTTILYVDSTSTDAEVQPERESGFVMDMLMNKSTFGCQILVAGWGAATAFIKIRTNTEYAYDFVKEFGESGAFSWLDVCGRHSNTNNRALTYIVSLSSFPHRRHFMRLTFKATTYISSHPYTMFRHGQSVYRRLVFKPSPRPLHRSR